MSEITFEHCVDVDANGVLVVRFAGIFDVDKWGARALDSDSPGYNGRFDLDRPVVIDLTSFVPPASGWSAGAHKVFSVTKKRGAQRGRRALIVGENTQARIAVNFFIKFKEAVVGESDGLRVFTSFDEGYAWATEGWRQSHGG